MIIHIISSPDTFWWNLKSYIGDEPEKRRWLEYRRKPGPRRMVWPVIHDNLAFPNAPEFRRGKYRPTMKKLREQQTQHNRRG